MSTWHEVYDDIKALEAGGDLYCLRPKSVRDRIRRPMYVVPEIWDALNAIHPEVEEKDRFASLRADLEMFVTGVPLTEAYLKRLKSKSENVWAIRSKVPTPSVRVLGLFAARDVFICTNFHLRKDLGAFNSTEWRAAILTAEWKWKQLFLSQLPMTGDLLELASGVING